MTVTLRANSFLHPMAFAKARQKRTMAPRASKKVMNVSVERVKALLLKPLG